MKRTFCRFLALCLLPLLTAACSTPQKSGPVAPASGSLTTSTGSAIPSGTGDSIASATMAVSLNKPFLQTLFYGSGVAASPGDFIARARHADYILIGERHTSASHHEAQAEIISLLAENGLCPAIGLEMIPAKLQARLDRFNTGEISVDELPSLMDWANVWGFDFALYRPIFVAAKQYHAPVHGLNVSPDVVKSIRKYETPASIPADQQRELPPVIQYPTTIQRKKLSRFFKQHASMLMTRKNAGSSQDQRPRPQGFAPVSTNAPAATAAKHPEAIPSPPQSAAKQSPSASVSAQPGRATPPLSGSMPTPSKSPAPNHGTKALHRFITIQSLWDSAMGYNATRIAHTGPKVILAGGAHVEYGYGIAHRIRHYAPDAEILIVMPLDSPRHAKTGEADFYFLDKR